MVNVLSLSQVEEIFGKFEYEELGNGLIKIDSSWVKENLTTYNFPIVGLLRCHKLVQPSFLKIFTEIENQNLTEFVTLKGGGGVYCPRHTLWDKRKPLSKHSWAICIDMNVAANPYGKISNLPLSFNRTNLNTSKIIDIFEKNNFMWGGIWNSKDPMHLEVSPDFKPIVEVKLSYPKEEPKLITDSLIQGYNPSKILV